MGIRHPLADRAGAGDERGDLERARQAERVARDSGADLQIAIAASWMARLRLAQGDLAEASALERERAANADGAAATVRAVDRINSARVLRARGRHHEALRLLEQPREAAETGGRVRDLIEILRLQALALWASNEKERAVNTLAEALALGAPEGYVRTFVDEDQYLQPGEGTGERAARRAVVRAGVRGAQAQQGTGGGEGEVRGGPRPASRQDARARR